MTLSDQAALTVALLVFLSIGLLSGSLILYLQRRSERQRVVEKIRKAAEGTTTADVPPPAATRQEPLLVFVGQLVERIGRRLMPGEETDLPLRRLRFLRAGLRSPNAPAVYWGVKCILAAFFPLCYFLVHFIALRGLSPTQSMFVGIVCALAGFYLPDSYIRIQTSRRRSKILAGLADAFDLLVVCIEAGMGLDAAMGRVAEEIRLGNQPLSEELNLYLLEVRAGKRRQDALRNLARRADVEDLQSFVSLMIQTERFGTSVAQALRVYSETLRTKRYQRAEELAAKLPVKMLLPLAFFILPSLMLTIVGPAFIRIFRMFIAR